MNKPPMLRSTGADLVPLAHRVRHMQIFRALAVAVVAVLVVLDPTMVEGSIGALAAGTLIYGAACLAWGWLWQRLGRRALVLFGGMLLVDGVYLAWATHHTGGPASPLRYVILLHLIAVALLASHRTSLKLVLWHSLLALVSFYGEQTGALPTAGPAAEVGEAMSRMQMFLLVAWLVTVVTASFSAVNERELRRRRYDLEALARFTADLEDAADPNAVATMLLRCLLDVFGFRRAVLVASRSGAAQLLAQQGCARATEEIGHHPGSLLERVKRDRDTMLLAALDTHADPWLHSLMPGARNLVVVSLSGKEGHLGALVCEHDLRSGTRIEQRVVAMVERFTAHTALALQNSWLVQDILDAATTDGLTGIRNRRAFDDLLAQEIIRSDRTGEPVSLLLLDIDHFKRLNDELGHQAGDDVLKEFGAALAANCRPFDLPARYGGEEFAVILPGCRAGQARAIAERIRRAATSQTTCAPITASGGVATYPDHALTGDFLIAAADAALYQAKHAGRDRLVAASDPTADGHSAQTTGARA